MSRAHHPAPHPSHATAARLPAASYVPTISSWFQLPLHPRPTLCLSNNLPLPAPGQILLLTGPSGSGKSSLLRHYRRILPGPTLNLDRIRLPRRPIVDLFPHLGLTQTLRLLSRVGLAEAHSYLLPPQRLSTGQRWRLRLALALSYCETNPTNPVFNPANAVFPPLAQKTNPTDPTCLLADEFAALLDPLTAATIAHLLRRQIACTPRLCAILATSRDDLLPILRPDITIHCDFGQVHVGAGHAPPSVPPPNTLGHQDGVRHCFAPTLPGRLSLSPGRATDYAALSRFHYRCKPPATFAAVWSIHYTPFTRPNDRQLVAVAVLSYPTLNLHLRDRILHLSHRTPSDRIRFINQHIRTISRIIVHPTFRSLGLARTLIQHVLAHAPTRYTEALALMARATPLFSLAGMTEYPQPDPRKPLYYLFERPGSSNSIPAPGGKP